VKPNDPGIGRAARKSAGAIKAWQTRRSPRYRAAHTERASKIALADWCKANGWRVAFFEGPTGAPRTGVVDALLARIKPGTADLIEVRLVQLKAGCGGLTAAEIARLKGAVSQLRADWALAAFDGTELHFVPNLPASEGRQPRAAVELVVGRGPRTKRRVRTRRRE